MAALAHARCDTTECKLWRLQPKEHDFYAIALLLPISEVAEIGDAAESSLEGKIDPSRYQTVDLLHKETPSS